jgi:hypothetical protein
MKAVTTAKTAYLLRKVLVRLPHLLVELYQAKFAVSDTLFAISLNSPCNRGCFAFFLFHPLLVDFIVGSKSRNISYTGIRSGRYEEEAEQQVAHWNKVAVIIDRLRRFSVSVTS